MSALQRQRHLAVALASLALNSTNTKQQELFAVEFSSHLRALATVRSSECDSEYTRCVLVPSKPWNTAAESFQQLLEPSTLCSSEEL
jgi:hypothetical protein